VEDIKLGLVCEGKTEYSQFLHPFGNESKGKAQLSSEQSVARIRNRLGIGPTSSVDESDCEKLAQELVREMPQHTQLIKDFRTDAWDQMTGGKAVLVQTVNGIMNVRGAHNAALVNRHAHNNNLNKNIIQQVSKSAKSTASANDLLLGHLENGSSTVIDLVGNSDDKLDTSTNAGDECDTKEASSADDEIQIILNSSLDTSNPDSSTDCRKRSISSVSFSDETVVDNLFLEVRSHCFRASLHGNQYDREAFKQLYVHLATDCPICKKVIYDMLATGVGSSMEEALNAIEVFMPMHYEM
jgi:hypothetical protein